MPLTVQHTGFIITRVFLVGSERWTFCAQGVYPP